MPDTDNNEEADVDPCNPEEGNWGELCVRLGQGTDVCGK